MNVVLPGRPDGQVEHTLTSGWRVCESSGRCAFRLRPSLSPGPPGTRVTAAVPAPAAGLPGAGLAVSHALPGPSFLGGAQGGRPVWILHVSKSRHFVLLPNHTASVPLRESRKRLGALGVVASDAAGVAAVLLQATETSAARKNSESAFQLRAADPSPAVESPYRLYDRPRWPLGLFRLRMGQYDSEETCCPAVPMRLTAYSSDRRQGASLGRSGQGTLPDVSAEALNTRFHKPLQRKPALSCPISRQRQHDVPRVPAGCCLDKNLN
jgi:hypothetical protein